MAHESGGDEPRHPRGRRSSAAGSGPRGPRRRGDDRSSDRQRGSQDQNRRSNDRSRARAGGRARPNDGENRTNERNRGGDRDRDQRPTDAAEENAAREHPKVRTAHGTRVARSIVCVRCGATDTLHFIPRHQARALCRQCAADTLDVSDRDAGIHPPTGDDAPPVAPPPPSSRRTTKTGVIRVRRRDEDG